MTAEEKKAKHAAYMRKWYRRHPGAKRASYLKNADGNRRKARDRMARKRATDPAFRARQDASNRAYAIANRAKVSAYQKAWRAAHRDRLPGYGRKFMAQSRVLYLIGRAKIRAKRRGVPFSPLVDDITIPEFCPVLGIKLAAVGRSRNDPAAPSLDRIIPELGYVRGNVRVISNRANSLKSNATADELIRVANWVVRETARVRSEIG